MKHIGIIGVLIFFSFSAGAQETCVEIFSAPSFVLTSSQEQELQQTLIDASSECSSPCSPKKLAQGISRKLTQKLRDFSVDKKRARGLAIITATMVGSAALSSGVMAILPGQFSFLSQLIAQVSTLGVIVIGAPIWEPASSAFRKFAFGISNNRSKTPADRSLEILWTSTQEKYSHNAQMSRNVINSFLLAVQNNFFEARRAMLEGNPEFAIDQIAESAVRMHRLFAEISPEDESVRLAIQSTFTRGVENPSSLKEKVLERIRFFDPAASDPEIYSLYERMINSWLSAT
jgi:hypothetical protein